MRQEVERILCTMSSERPCCTLLRAAATMPPLLSPIERGQGHSRVPYPALGGFKCVPGVHGARLVQPQTAARSGARDCSRAPSPAKY